MCTAERVEDMEIEERDKIIMANQGLVCTIARQYSRRYKMDYEDLKSEGNLGLIRAIEKFDSDINPYFGNYALYWIKARIKRYVHRNFSIVRDDTTKENRVAFWHKELRYDMSLSKPCSGKNGEDTGSTLLDFLEDESTPPDEACMDSHTSDKIIMLLKKVLPSLDVREKDILFSRLYTDNPCTLLEIGKRHEICRERIRQIESILKKKLKKVFNQVR